MLVNTLLDRYDMTCPIPEYTPNFEEIAKQQRINIDNLKQEVTDHIDSELDRFKRQIQIMQSPGYFE